MPESIRNAVEPLLVLLDDLLEFEGGYNENMPNMWE